MVVYGKSHKEKILKKEFKDLVIVIMMMFIFLTSVAFGINELLEINKYKHDGGNIERSYW
jgi:hypothetical protein